MPTLSQAASAYAALQNVVRLEPEDAESWALGGILLIDHLGMLEEALGVVAAKKTGKSSRCDAINRTNCYSGKTRDVF